MNLSCLKNILRTTKRPSVVLQQSTFPDYRQETLALLCEHWGNSIQILVGRVSFDPTTQTSITLGDRVRFVDNRYLFSRRLLWQRGVLRSLVTAEVAIVELNPRILSVWLVLVFRKILRRHTVLWGHVWSRSGPTSRTNWLRARMRELADTLLVYTDTQRQELIEIMPDARVIVAPNAMYRYAEIHTSISATPSNIIYVGRLIPSKKPLLLLNAYRMATEHGLSQDCDLVFVGDGPERSSIEDIIKSDPKLREHVAILGHVQPSSVRDIYSTALVSASPGYVGLSATQSFSFGVPMIIARDEPHAPEVEAARVGFNALFVPSDDCEALASAILTITQDRQQWITKREDIARDCASRYTVEKMAQGIIEAATPCH